MSDIIAVLGANGVYARHLLPPLAADGFRVRALVRRPEAATLAKACGAEIRTADIFDVGSMTAALEGCTTGINLATSLPGPSGRGDFDANDRLREEGTPNWVAACKAAGVKRALQQGISFGNGAGGDAWGDETTRFFFLETSTVSRAIDAAAAMEASVTESGLDWAILRGGLYYGPGTGFDDGWHARAAAGKLRTPGDGSEYVSLCHIADMARATVAALYRWPSHQALIICDDEPATWADVFGYLATLYGQPPPAIGGPPGFNSFRLSNARAKHALGWSPVYASWRMGLAR